MKIEVVLPFKVRLAPKQPIREFTPGVHELTAEEAANWFVKACLKEKRARRVPDDEGIEPIAEPQPAEAKSAEAKPEETAAEVSLMEEMLEVFPALKDEDMKADGVPRVAAVEKALGESVTAEQVAAAWEKYQQEKD
ncbi:MAG: hypothetical protein AB7D51_01745 [Desulfovibrionaceae bacterium]